MKALSVEEAVAMIPNGASVMIGGFMGVGTPERLLDELVRQKKSELSIISNDAAIPGKGIGKLFDASLVSALTTSHIGLNPNVQKQQQLEQKQNQQLQNMERKHDTQAQTLQNRQNTQNNQPPRGNPNQNNKPKENDKPNKQNK